MEHVPFKFGMLYAEFIRNHGIRHVAKLRKSERMILKWFLKK